MTRALFLLLILAGCASKPEVTKERVKTDKDDQAERAMRAFVEGAEQLARGTPKSLVRAKELLSEAVRLNPVLWEAQYDLGLTLREQGELDAAREPLLRAHDASKESQEPLLALAELELARGDRERSSAYLQQLLALDPNRVDARLALAAVERERGKLDEALTAARAVLVRDPRETRALNEIGRIYRAREEYDVSELVLEKSRVLAEGDPQKSAPVYNELGLLALARGDTQLAFTHFTKAEQLDPRFQPAHVNQGSVLLRAGDYEGAEKAYRAALKSDDQVDSATLDARIGLGIAQRGQSKYKEARATYEKVLDAHPTELAALYDLAVLLADFMNQRKEALPLFERYLALAPKSDSHRESAERYLQDIRMSMGSAP